MKIPATSGGLWPLCFFVFAALPAAGAAAELYRHRGPDGQWHYSDRPPDSSTAVETMALETAAPEPRVLIRRENIEGGAILHALNEYHSPVEVELFFTSLENAPPDVKRRSRFVVPARSEMPLLTLTPHAANQSLRYAYEMRFVLGDPEAAHRQDLPYRVPTAVSSAFPVSQAFYGAATHNDEANAFAVDMVMPVGTQIYAARAGLVIEVSYKHFAGGTDLARDGRRANIVRILHDDGTMAIYAHLDRATARVRTGERVREGQYIANSGNTGFTSGPHLHFAVMKNEGFNLVSIPFQFRGPDGSAVLPEQGMVLTAYQ